MSGSLVKYSGGEAVIINTTGVDTSEIGDALRADPATKHLADTLGAWVERVSESSGDMPARRRRRVGGLLERDRWLTPDTTYGKIQLAREAMKDDIVGTAADGTEAFALSKVAIYADDEDEEDVWNQWAGDINLDDQMRKAWRILFSDSQFAAITWWDRRSYKVRGNTNKGNAKRKTFDNILVPIGWTYLDTTKVVPIGNLMFGQERLAYRPTAMEAMRIERVLYSRDNPGANPLAAIRRGPPGRQQLARIPTHVGDALELDDPLIEQLFVGRYYPGITEWRLLSEDGVDPTYLYEMRADMAFRHCLTRPDYRRFSDVRLEGIFPFIDLKAQLMQLDRVTLIGGPLRVDQRVVTPQGWREVGTIEVGDEVMGADGCPTRVRGVYPQGYLPLYKVRFTDGAEVICDDSHRWTVRSASSSSGYWKTLTLREIMDAGLRWKNRWRFRVPIAAAVEMPAEQLPLDPYLVGYYLGDGDFDFGSSPRITSSEDDDFPWMDVLPAGVSCGTYDYSAEKCPRYSMRGDEWRNNPVLESLAGFGLRGVNHDAKFIPDQYMLGSIAQRWALLQGLCDSDGHYHSRGLIEYSTVSEKLAAGVAELVESLGGIAYTTVRQPYGKAKLPCFRVWLAIHQQEAPFRLRRKVAQWQPRVNPFVRSIVDVERVLDGEAVCISVENEDGLFLTEGHVVTHNSHFIILVTIGDDKVPGTQPEIDSFRAQAFTLATVPVIVGDQRLKIEIITPKQDHILERSKYDTVNAAIFENVWSAFHHDASRTEDPVKTAKVIAKNLESRRLMLRRTIEREIIDRMRKRNEQLNDRAKLVFTPSQISLAFDPAFASYLLDLRASNELSRNTALGTFDISQEDEARMRKREEQTYDKIFKTIAPAGTAKQAGGRVPAGDPADNPGAAKAQQRAAGRKAGGGGTADGSGRGQPARRPRNLANENQKITAASLLEADRDELIDIATDLEIVGRHKMRLSALRVAIRNERAARRAAAIERAEIADEYYDELEEEDETE